MGEFDDKVREFFQSQVEVLRLRINLKLSAYQTSHDGFTDMNKDIPTVFKIRSEHEMEILLYYGGLAVWIEEYGSGSAMDTESPYYSDYRSKARASRIANNMAFTGHRKGDIYYSPDGTKHVKETDILHDRNLENPPGRLTPYVPEYAQHIIRNEIVAWVQEIKPKLTTISREAIIKQIKEGVGAK